MGAKASTSSTTVLSGSSIREDESNETQPNKKLFNL